VENIPKKLEQNRPMKTPLLFFCPYDKSGAELASSGVDFLRNKCSKTRQISDADVHSSGADFGFPRMLHFWVIFQQTSIGKLSDIKKVKHDKNYEGMEEYNVMILSEA